MNFCVEILRAADCATLRMTEFLVSPIILNEDGYNTRVQGNQV